MNTEELLVQVKDCATFFYQNSEQEAYRLLNNLLPHINQTLQAIALSTSEYEEAVVMILRSFLEAYQEKDNLALADILEYEIVSVLEMESSGRV